MRRNPRRFVPFLAFIFLALPGQTVWGQASRPTLLVLGFENKVRKKIWTDARIGFGLSALLGQLLYESGCFRPIEEKGEVLAKVKLIQSDLWEKPGTQSDGTPSSQLIRGLKTDLRASGTVLSANRARSRSFIGVFSSARETVTVDLEVSVASADGRRALSARGRGKSSFKAKAVGFTIRRRKVLFDETTVGRATKAALQMAVKRLLAKLRERTKKSIEPPPPKKPGSLTGTVAKRGC